MSALTDQMDTLSTKIKAELGIFLQNDSTLAGMQSQIAALSDKNTASQLEAQRSALAAKQSSMESSATDWLKKIADLKDKITANPDIGTAINGNITAAIFSAGFWKDVGSYANEAIPLVNEGLKLSQDLVSQNGAVALLEKSVKAGAVLVPTTANKGLTTGLIWLYGALGVGLAYLLSQKKK